MYIQLTDKCNMSCAHCGMSCTSKGSFMSFEVFKAAVAETGGMVTIGGGEPTLHPEFTRFLMYALSHEWTEDVWLATNGSNTEISLMLAGMAKKGILGVDLSQDEFHDPIDEKVVDAFTKPLKGDYYKGKDRRAIRNVTDRITKAGRAVKNELWSVEDTCICSGPIVKPNGDVYMCGCKKSMKLGNVLTGFEVSDYDCIKEARKNKNPVEKAEKQD